jgi:ubiquinone/menaquinone biosynthesis C-methylase UbiE
MTSTSISSRDRLVRPWSHPRGLLGHLAGLEMSVGRHRDVALALELLDLADGARVIEVGCGPGVMARALSTAVGSGSVTAIEPSTAMLAQARLRNRSAVAAGRVRLLEGRAEALPLDGGLFTHYLSTYTTSHWSSIASGLREARRVLEPAGRLVIGTRRPESIAEIEDLAHAAGFAAVAGGERTLGRRQVGVVTATA